MSNLTAINVQVELFPVNCGACGGTYAINERYRAKKYESGGTWNCPYCKVAWGYSNDNENSRLKRELAELKNRQEQTLRRANEAEFEREQARKALIRTTKRHAAGTCPCCNRTFKQVAAHMKKKHPDYKP